MFLPYLVRNNKYRVIPYTHQSHAEWILENKEADLRNMAILRAKNEEQSKKLGTNLAQSEGLEN